MVIQVPHGSPLRWPITAAAHAEEAGGRNALPERYAFLLSRRFGFSLDVEIVQANRPRRTGQDGAYRLIARAEFDGAVESGRDGLIVDDSVTQGGTLADLRSYIERNAGHVIGASTLTGSRQSERLAPRRATLIARRARFPDLERRWKETFGYDFDGLTEGEATYLRRSDPADALGDRVIARAQARADTPA